MTTPRPENDQDRSDDTLDPTDPEIADMLRELSGEPTTGETRAAFALDGVAEVEDAEDTLTGTERERGYLEAGVDPTGGVGPEATIQSVEDLLERERTSDETSDPYIAAEEGVPWVPPVDPPIAADERDPDDATVAADDDEVTARVREALRADAQTTVYADRLVLESEGDLVTLRGTVADIEDLDSVLAVAAEVAGVAEVVDEMEIEGV